MTLAVTPERLVREAFPPTDPPMRAWSWKPRSRTGLLIFRTLRYLPESLAAEVVEAMRSIVVMESALFATIIWGRTGKVEPLGLIGTKVVTDVGVGFIVDAFQNSVEVETMKYHSLGTGSTAEAAGDTALVTELTTEYTGNVRATGTTTETATNIYSTVGANLLDGAPGAALREHGVHSASSAGVLLDRTVYSAITLSSGDTFTSDYRLTLTAGS